MPPEEPPRTEPPSAEPPADRSPHRRSGRGGTKGPVHAAGFPTSKALLLALLVAGVGLGLTYRDQLSFAALAEQQDRLSDLQRQSPAVVYGAAFALYVLVTGLSLPGAAPLTVVYGWLFGFGPALLLVSFASTTGATLAFLISRHLLRDVVRRRLGGWLSRFDEALRREGAFYLFTLRLVVAAPFFVINLVMGLTPIRTATFWWVSQLGMLPGTAVFVYAGSAVPSLAEIEGPGSVLSPHTIVAFALLGVFPLAVKHVVGKLRPKGVEPTPPGPNGHAV